MTPDQIEQLSSGAAALGIALSERQLGQFNEFACLLEEWNNKMNLTRVAADKIVSLHFLDSLALSKAVELTTGASLIDVGTGAGFPGIPIAVAFPQIKVTLLDSTRKKLNFVDEVCQRLGLINASIVNARAEDAAMAGGTLRDAFDVATARAVAPMEVLVEWLLPFVRIGGTIVAMKSDKVEDELAGAEEIISRLGGGEAVVRSVHIPGTEIQRKMVVIEKVKATPNKYPRKGLKRTR
jgi:16S rRNA (guanine527-N7)-methyltransferase